MTLQQANYIATKTSGRAKSRSKAMSETTAPETIGVIRTNYRLAKSAEDTRIRIDHGLSSFARVYLTSWTPDGEELSRTQANKLVSDTIKNIRAGNEPETDLHDHMYGMVMEIEPVRETFEQKRKDHRKAAEKIVKDFPGWERISHVRGFSVWGLVALIGEAGDIGMYSGRRKLYKRLGLAPDECYPKGEKKTGRKIPRNTRGRIMGIIADPLLRAQWRGEKGDVPAHAIGPYGQVYADVKARKLEEGFTKGHADKYARRAMTKALIGDVWAAWHGEDLRFPAG